MRGRRARRAVRVGPELGGARRARLWLENGTASTAARVAGRAVADGLFVPIDECSLDASAITAARALACAGGAAYFSLQLVERARLALLSSEALAAAGCIFDAECDAGWRLPLAALKLVLYAAATADSETHAYFLGAQLELAWALLDRPPPPPPRRRDAAGPARCAAGGARAQDD